MVSGSLGLVLLVAGLLGGVEALILVGVAGGTVSLVSALVWREQLITQWRAQQGRRPRR